MDMLDNFCKGNQQHPAEKNPGVAAAASDSNQANNANPSKSDLMHSAQVLADVAKSQLFKEPSKHDKAEVAGATADLLNAVSEYQNMDESTGIGKYLDKAEGYLRQYQTNNPHPVDQSNSSKPASGEDSADDKPSSHGGGIVDFLMKK